MGTTTKNKETAGQPNGIVLTFGERSALPVGCVSLAKALGLRAGDRLISETIDRHAPYGEDHRHRDKLWERNGMRFVQFILRVKFIGTRWVVCDQHMRLSGDGCRWDEWEIREVADISAVVWHWLREYRADWQLVRCE